MKSKRLIFTAKTFIILWIILVFNFKKVPAEKCLKIDDCSCRKSNGKVISLRKIDGGSGGPAFKNIPSVFYPYRSPHFDWNPCTTFSKDKGCNDALMCENQMGQKTSTACAQSVARFEENKDGSTTIVYRPYKTESWTRTVQIILKCDERQYPGSTGDGVNSGGQSSDYLYRMTFTSKCACDDGCVSPSPHPVYPTHSADPTVKPKPKGLSKGSILLLVFFVLIVVYLIVGILIKKFRTGTGSIPEMIPNYEFWAGIPSLIEDGIVFTCSCMKIGCLSIYYKCCKQASYAKI